LSVPSERFDHVGQQAVLTDRTDRLLQHMPLLLHRRQRRVRNRELIHEVVSV
jgi:hypothetical protein